MTKRKYLSLNDSEAKKILLKWPSRTKSIWNTPNLKGYWIQACPKLNKKSTIPSILIPGATHFKIQPDGLWVFFNDLNYVDLICIEVSTSIQNLNDKRSRYVPIASSLLLKCPTKWLIAEMPIQKSKKIRWKAIESITKVDTNLNEYPLPSNASGSFISIITG